MPADPWNASLSTFTAMWWQIAGQVRNRYLIDLAKRLRSAEVKCCPHVGTTQVGKAELESREEWQVL